MERNKIIINTSIKGIIVNILLVVFKSIIGFITNSIAIVLDALNNLSDVLSSVVTIIGTKLAGKAPDKEHPYGHRKNRIYSNSYNCNNNSCSRIYSYKRINYKNYK